MPINFDLGGKVYDPVEVTISPEHVQQYARASGDENPRYQIGEGQIASPIFLVAPGLPFMEAVATDPELNVENMLMLVHGEQQFDYHRPVVPGTTLVLSPSLEAVEDKGSGATYRIKIEVATDVGDPIADLRATVFVRGGGSGKERPRGDRPVPPVKGEVAAEFDRHVRAEMPVLYAEASGDHNPIHVDDEVARSVGLPGAILHGLGTLSLVTGGLVEHLMDGDSTRLKMLRARFTDMVFPDTTIATTVWATEGKELLFETRREDGAVVVAGMIETAPS